MVQYIVACMAFQLVFLIVYDFFLKKETFFQWNRAYLLVTHVLSLVLPWVKIEALKTTVPNEYFVHPEFLWDMETVAVEVTGTERPMIDLSWQEGVLYLGMLVAALFFGYKMLQLYQLRKKGTIHWFASFTQVIVSNSNLAFSFFRSIFLGDKILEAEHENIIQHELVHIRQRHSWDLLFFELLRIIMWFNPLVYVYQSRISELHEFIADAHVAKRNKKEQYQLLLSQAFQTQNISFVNQFFKSSLIKKRIVMLQKSKSKKIWQLKYLLLIPLVVGMLFYTSLEGQEIDNKDAIDDRVLIEQIEEEVEENIKQASSIRELYTNYPQFAKYDSLNPILSKEDFFRQRIIFNKVIQKRNNEMANDLNFNYSRIIKPSTLQYKDYLSRLNAFQTVDTNLDVSIDYNKHDVTSIARESIDTNASYVFEVKDVSSLTAAETRSFNRKMNDVFEKEDSGYTSLVLTDNTHFFRIFGKTGQNTSNRTKVRDYYTFSDQSKAQPSQESNANSGEDIILFNLVDEVPVFPGCEGDDDKRGCFHESIRQHIRKNFRYPEEAQERGIQGVVNVTFLIDQQGDIKDIRAKGGGDLLTEEARRNISLLPSMKPGSHQGKIVKVPFSIPITFKLPNDDTKEDISFSPDNFTLLPVAKEGKSREWRQLVTRYNELIIEHKRLLTKTNNDNPVVKNLELELRRMQGMIVDEYEKSILVPFAVIDEVPVFPGCENEEDARACFQAQIQKHISKHFRYPEEAQKQGIQGRVNIMFIMDENGTIGDIRMRGPHELLENEAERIIKLLPQVVPGKEKGKSVRVPFSIPITFKLQGETPSDTEKLDGKVIQALQNSKAEDFPLVLIDGEETSRKELLEKVNPDDIGSITVLKGKAARKKYGALGKNGVIEISTKKMALGAMKIRRTLALPQKMNR